MCVGAAIKLKFELDSATFWICEICDNQVRLVPSFEGEFWVEADEIEVL